MNYNEHIDSSRQIAKLIQRFSNIFANVSSRPYRCSPRDRAEIENQIKQLLQAGLVEESTNPFASAVTLVFMGAGLASVLIFESLMN